MSNTAKVEAMIKGFSPEDLDLVFGYLAGRKLRNSLADDLEVRDESGHRIGVLMRERTQAALDRILADPDKVKQIQDRMKNPGRLLEFDEAMDMLSNGQFKSSKTSMI